METTETITLEYGQNILVQHKNSIDDVGIGVINVYPEVVLISHSGKVVTVDRPADRTADVIVRYGGTAVVAQPPAANEKLMFMNVSKDLGAVHGEVIQGSNGQSYKVLGVNAEHRAEHDEDVLMVIPIDG